MDLFTRSFLLLFVLLNPFILSVYLLELVRTLDMRRFTVLHGDESAAQGVEQERHRRLVEAAHVDWYVSAVRTAARSMSRRGAAWSVVQMPTSTSRK